MVLINAGLNTYCAGHAVDYHRNMRLAEADYYENIVFRMLLLFLCFMRGGE